MSECQRFYNAKKRCAFHHRGLECKSRKSRDNLETGKFDLGIQNEAGQRLTEFCQENALVIANTLFPSIQEKTVNMGITRWLILKSDGLYSLQLKMEKLYTISQSGADCGSDHELLISKFRLKLQTIGKPTRPLRYDLSQIPYDYTVE